MVSKEIKKSNLTDKLQLLRSITNSHAQDKNSIIEDASNYIEELQDKIQVLNKDIQTAQTSNNNNTDHHEMKVRVQTLENGFLVNVKSGKSNPGLLVSILEAFEGMGLNVLEARVSCEEHMFLFQAVGQQADEENERLSAHYVQQMVSNAIDNWSGSDDQ